MLYRNIKSGAVIEVSCELKGNWEMVVSEKPAKASADTSDSAKPVKKIVKRVKK